MRCIRQGRARAGRWSMRFLLPALVACADPELSGTQDVLVISSAQGPNDYELQVESVTATDFSTLEGEAVHFLSRPFVLITDNGENMELAEGEPIEVEYTTDGDTLVATDYFGLLAVTAYAHLSEARSHFLASGLPAERVPQLPALFYPQFSTSLDGARIELTDNMAFSFPYPSFLVLREDTLDEIPLATNRGIATHEYSHAVLHFLTMGGDGSRAELALGWDDESTNHWSSLHEGLADVHGISVTEDPTFLAHSAQAFAEPRDVTRGHIATDAQLRGLAAVSPSNYDPYPLGTVLASAFWSYAQGLEGSGMGRRQALDEMARLALDSVGALSLDQSGFHLADYLAAVSATTSDAQWCQAVQSHFPTLTVEAGC